MKTGAASAVFALLRSAKSEKASFYEARLSAYEAFYGIAAKYEAPQMLYEAKPFQASCFFALKSRQKKWRLAFLSSPAILNCILSLKTQNFAVKSNSENRFTFRQKNSE